MRYDDWDVILFSRDSHVPIQEFKTTCYISTDESGGQLPVLTCYISSLPQKTPFRISVHSWATQARPSVLIESQRKPNQKMVYSAQIIVDGTRSFRGLFDITSKWPQEIAHMNRSSATGEQGANSGPCLEFPAFHLQTLMQTSWNARDPSGRIQIILSEQLINKASTPNDSQSGAKNDIVCFAFQHAPLELLEQTGISWPIRNPLYRPSADGSARLPCQISSYGARSAELIGHDDARSPLTHISKPSFTKSNVEPMQRPRSHPPPISYLQRPPSTNKIGRSSAWEDSYGATTTGSENLSFGRLSAKRNAIGSTIDLSTMDFGRASLDNDGHNARWASHGMSTDRGVSFNQAVLRGGHDNDREVVVSLRDDQLGQIIDAFSPSQTFNNLPPTSSSQIYESRNRPTMGHGYYLPKNRDQSGSTRPMPGTASRTSSRFDLNNGSRSMSNSAHSRRIDYSDRPQDRPPVMYHPSQTKESRASSQLRPPTSHPLANRVPTPNPFVQPTQHYDIDTYIGSAPTQYLDYLRPTEDITVPSIAANKAGSAHAPSTMSAGKVRDGKSAHHSSHVHGSALREQCPPSHSNGMAHTTRNVPGEDTTRHSSLHDLTVDVADVIEVIDVDAIDPNLEKGAQQQQQPRNLSPFKLNHKAGMSSIDSTGRLERQLFSALGEELDNFDTQHIDTTGMGPELAAALAGTSVAEPGSDQVASPVTASDHSSTGKRKRHNTIGSEQDPGRGKKIDSGEGIINQDEGNDEAGSVNAVESLTQAGEDAAT